MPLFVDTSAFFAVLDADDRNHSRAAAFWGQLSAEDEVLICTNYVLVETIALLQRRLGIQAVRAFTTSAQPMVEVIWVEPDTHDAAMAALLIAHRRDLSLVDCVSFEHMRRTGMERAFTFDRHFSEQGFVAVPSVGG